LSLGQLLRMICDIKRYIFNPVTLKLVLPKLRVASNAINHQMVVIQVQVIKKLLRMCTSICGFGVNIIMKKLRMQLNLSKPKLALYNLCMV
jgi:hypothetical protein